MNFDEIANLSLPVALAFALMFVGYTLKRSPVADWLIPPIIMILGSIVYGNMADPAKTPNIQHPTAMNYILGLVIGGCSTAFHQTAKQFLQNRLNLGGTTFIKKSDCPPGD